MKTFLKAAALAATLSLTACKDNDSQSQIELPEISYVEIVSENGPIYTTILMQTDSGYYSALAPEESSAVMGEWDISSDGSAYFRLTNADDELVVEADAMLQIHHALDNYADDVTQITFKQTAWTASFDYESVSYEMTITPLETDELNEATLQLIRDWLNIESENHVGILYSDEYGVEGFTPDNCGIDGAIDVQGDFVFWVNLELDGCESGGNYYGAFFVMNGQAHGVLVGDARSYQIGALINANN